MRLRSPWCSVKLCESTDDVQTIGFPRDAEKASRWKRLCGISENDYSFGRKKICIQHFERKDFYKRAGGRIELRPNIDPYLNLPSPKAIVEMQKLTRIHQQLVQDKRRLESELVRSNDELNWHRKLLKEATDENNKLKAQILNAGRVNVSESKFVTNDVRIANRQGRIITTEGNIFYNKFNQINPTIRRLVFNEIKNQDRDICGRRFGEDIKMFCLNLYLSAPKAYSILQSIFTWPSKETLKKNIDNNQMKTGISDSMLEFLKESDFGPQRVCSLLLNEMHLDPSCTFDVESDSAEQSNANAESNPEEPIKSPATALTYTLCSADKAIKIPLCFFFGSSKAGADDLSTFTTNIITKLYSVNVLVRLIICDQSNSNQLLAKKFEITVDKPWFDLLINDSPFRISVLFDISHVYKSIRDNLIQYPLSFLDENGDQRTATWKHIEIAFELDQKREVPMCPKLTAKHIDPTSSQKTKVAYAMQIFSNSLSAAIKTMINDSTIVELNEEAKGTELLLKFMNDLFDCLNNRDSAEDKCLKQDNAAWTKLTKCLETLKYFRFVTETNRQQLKIACLSNLRLSIASFMCFQQFMNRDYQIDYILTGNYNQNPLENFFTLVRNNENGENGQSNATNLSHSFSMF